MALDMLKANALTDTKIRQFMSDTYLKIPWMT
jgi:hypothetical protein